MKLTDLTIENELDSAEMVAVNGGRRRLLASQYRSFNPFDSAYALVGGSSASFDQEEEEEDPGIAGWQYGVTSPGF
jgi:hypothetical protein